jgi:probable F420-dependent oxidoreductase
VSDRGALRLGVVFPHQDQGFAAGGAVSAEFAAAAEEAGYAYLAMPDHVLGAQAADRGDGQAPYGIRSPFREVFVHLGYLAARSTLELMPCVLVMPQRQAAVVAKQAAELDLLTGGKVRLGLGAGWNEPEFRGLGAPFARRGDLLDEQMTVLRLLWTREVVTFSGAFHQLDGVGICPLPVQRPIPLWLGGGSLGADRPGDRVIGRIAERADGWIAKPLLPPAQVGAQMDLIRKRAAQAGRDPDAIGLQASLRVPADAGGREIEAGLNELRAAGASHVTVELRGHGLTPAEHITRLATVAGVARGLA